MRKELCPKQGEIVEKELTVTKPPLTRCQFTIEINFLTDIFSKFVLPNCIAEKKKSLKSEMKLHALILKILRCFKSFLKREKILRLTDLKVTGSPDS